MSKLALLLLVLLSGCAHTIHEVHMSDYKPFESLTAGRWISAEASQTTFLGIVTQTNYVNEARQKLISSCSDGDIQGITTRYSTSLGFFSWENKIYLQALCVE